MNIDSFDLFPQIEEFEDFDLAELFEVWVEFFNEKGES